MITIKIVEEYVITIVGSYEINKLIMADIGIQMCVITLIRIKNYQNIGAINNKSCCM